MLARDLSYLMLADMFCGITTVSFFSPKRKICEALVSSISASVFVRESDLSSFDLNEGELLYMPSWNLELSVVEVYWVVIPHEERTIAATIISNELFFMI